MEKEGPNQQIELQDGRMLGYAEYGVPDGVPVFYFHGFPSSRLDWLFFDAEGPAAELNARIIAPDRPGHGLSDLQRGRRLLDWPADVAALADALQIDRFAVLGISGGGPYAAVCAYGIPERLTRAGIVSGMGPADAPGMQEGTSWTIPGQFPLARRLTLMLTSMGLSRDPDQFLSRSRETFSEPDGLLLDKPEPAKAFIAGMQEAFRSGTGGANHEAGLYTRPWGFQLQEIDAEVYLWHGGLDSNVPISVGRFVAGAIPNCKARFYEDEGHLALPHNRMEEILSALLA